MATHDLDHLLDELDQVGDTVTLFGREWTLPAEVDASTMLRVQRLQMKVALARKRGQELKPDDVLDANVDLETLVRRMGGSDNVDEWFRLGLGYRGLVAISRELYQIHSGGDDDSGKAPTQGRSKTSSNPRRKTTGKG